MAQRPVDDQRPLPVGYPSELPISERREDLLEAIRDNQVLVVAGETGSGKSTQLPKMCLELGLGADGKRIGHTQPRRLAARTIADRVAAELPDHPPKTVGYKVRFDDQVSQHTQIKLMTDGVLLSETQRDRSLRQYSVIIVDEAHERSLNIDFLLGYLKQLCQRRSDLKVIITSATIDTERFSKHFDDAPVIEVSGRMYPVEVRYQPLDVQTPNQANSTTANSGSGGPTAKGRQPNRRPPQRRSGAQPRSRPRSQTSTVQAEAISEAVQDLWIETDGDILVFCSGEQEIRDAIDAISELTLPNTDLLPLYARLSSAEQQRVFKRHKNRRVVVSTNVAETSVTVPGVRSVIDAGTARISRYSSRTKVQRLPIEAVSQASANQRSGRCGRLGPGICIRLYGEEDFETRDEFTEPEIRRTNLAAVILQMFSLGLGEAQNFPFVDPPDQSSIVDGLRLLEELDAIETGSSKPSGKSNRLTGIGKTLAKLPIDPRLGRMLIEAETNGSLREVLIIVAGLAVADPRERPADQKQAAREAHNVHADPDSDFITYLNLWRYLEAERKKTSGNQFKKKCRREYLNFLRIREWQATHKQLRRLAKDLAFSFSSTPAKPDAIHQAVLTGLLSQVGSKEVDKNPKQAKAKGNGRPGRRKGPATYHGTRNSTFAINPGSALSKAGGQWVMAAELVETSQVWARVVAGVDPEWICAAAEHLTKHSFGEPWWDAERGVAMTTERITLLGLTLVADRRTMLSTWSVVEARESFIHHALVLNDWNGSPFGFVEANQQTLVDVDEQEARYRTKDVEGRNDRIFAFFDERLPRGITNLGDFNGWWKQIQATEPQLLHFTVDDITEQDASAEDDHFPAEWVIGKLRLELGYEYDPSSEVDGVSIHVPVDTIGQLRPDPFEWTVPGFRPALIDALLRSLPKRFRKQLLPMNETVTWAQKRLRPSEASLFDALAELISQRANLEVKRTDFVISQVPQHLRPTFRVINDANESILDGKDLEELQTRLESHTRTALTKVGDDPSIASDIRRNGLTSWDFDRLEKSVVVVADGHQVKTYPALFDEGDTAGIDLFATTEERFDAMWEGVRRLLRIQLGSPLRQLDSHITPDAKLWLSAPPVQSKIQWYNDAIDSVLDHTIAAFGPLPETKPAFESLVAQARKTFDQQLRHAAAKLDDFVLGLVALDQKMDDHAPSPSKTDVAQHRDRLFYPGMMVGLGYARLDDASRYLTAMHTRIDSLKANPRRDIANMNLCLEVESEVYRLVHVQGKTVELEALVWQAEELRASLSAPSAFTSKQTVTAKKIRQQLKRISSAAQIK